MPTPVPLQPQESSLDRLVVGAPVSARHGARWASQIAYLLGRHGHRVCSHTVQALSARTSSSKRVQVQYLRSKLAQVALVAIELRDDATTVIVGSAPIPSGHDVRVTVTAPSGASWIERGTAEEPLDGSADISLPSPFLAGRKWLYGLLDVSGVSSTTVSTMTIDIAGSGGDTHLGLGTVQLVELPLASIKPESGESGLLISWPDPRNYLEEGASAAGPRGLSSLVDLEQQVVARQRWWWQILGYEDSAPTTGGDTWYRTGAAGAINWRGGLAAAYSPKWRTRVRQLHSGTFDVVARVRYYAASGGTISVKVTPVGGLTTTIAVTCSASAAWTTSSAIATLSLSTEQRVDIQVEGTGSGGDTIYLSNVTLYSAETP